MKKLIILVILFAFVGCNNSDEISNANNDSKSVDNTCYTSDIEIFNKDFIHENTGISFQYPSYWEFYFDHENSNQVLTDMCAELIIYKFNDKIYKNNLEDYIYQNYESKFPYMNKKKLELKSLPKYESLGYLIEINDNENFYNDILISQNEIGLFRIRINIKNEYKAQYANITKNINSSIKMPTEAFSFIKEEPESRQIVQDYSIQTIDNLCKSKILNEYSLFNKNDLNINKTIKISLPFKCSSYENQIISSLLEEQDRKTGRSAIDRPDESNDYQIHFIYLVTKSDPDNELDINISGQKLLNTINQDEKFSIDSIKNNYDISFNRLPLEKSEIESGKNESPDKPFEIISTYINKIGFNHPKKLYIVIMDSEMNCGKALCDIKSDWTERRSNVIIAWTKVLKVDNDKSINDLSEKIKISLDESKSLFSANKVNTLPKHWSDNEHCIMLGKTDGSQIEKTFFNNFKLKNTIEKIKDSNFKYQIKTVGLTKEIYFGNLIIKNNSTWCVDY